VRMNIQIIASLLMVLLRTNNLRIFSATFSPIPTVGALFERVTLADGRRLRLERGSTRPGKLLFGKLVFKFAG
jgi:hypothetical protein